MKIPYKDLPEEVKERHRETNRRWCSNHREQALADKRQRDAIYRQDPEKLARKQASDRAAWRKYRHTEKWRRNFWRAHLKHKYGITPEQYDVMLAQQNGLCAICHGQETVKYIGGIRRLCVDHNHTSGQVRGLLCSECNKALGNMHENVERLQSAIEYLNRYS